MGNPEYCHSIFKRKYTSTCNYWGNYSGRFLVFAFSYSHPTINYAIFSDQLQFKGGKRTAGVRLSNFQKYFEWNWFRPYRFTALECREILQHNCCQKTRSLSKGFVRNVLRFKQWRNQDSWITGISTFSGERNLDDQKTSSHRLQGFCSFSSYYLHPPLLQLFKISRSVPVRIGAEPLRSSTRGYANGFKWETFYSYKWERFRALPTGETVKSDRQADRQTGVFE